MATTDELARRRFQLMAAEWVQLMGARMRARRKELGLKQREVAARLPGDVDAQQVSKWERGVHKPNDATLEHIAAILETTVPALMSDAPRPGTPDLMQALSTARPADLEDLYSRLDDLQEAVDRVELYLREQASRAVQERVRRAARQRRRRRDTRPEDPAAGDG